MAACGLRGGRILAREANLDMEPKNQPADESERELQEHEDLEQGMRRGEKFYNPPEECDYCHQSLADRRFFVDGMTRRGGMMWGFMCSDCFSRMGVGVAYGEGQLYTQMDDGSWLMTGGFPPPGPDEEDPWDLVDEAEDGDDRKPWEKGW